MMSSTDQLEGSNGSSIGQFRPTSTVKQKNAYIGYLLGIPLGFTGAHHFYLGNYSLGFTYLFTLGLAGLGWIVDWFRMGTLVNDANRVNEVRWRWENEEAGLRDVNVLNYQTDNRRLMDCYLMVFITGLTGSHHFYLKRYGWGIAYFLTAGLGGGGWLLDWFRLPSLHQRYKDELKAKSEGVEQLDKYYHLDDVYACCMTLGVVGLHRFYLEQYVWGTAYLLTFGFFGLGWLLDMIRMPGLVKNANRKIWQDEENRRLLSGHRQAQIVYTDGNTYVPTQPPTSVDKDNPGPPVAATMHGYYFPAQAPTYQHEQQDSHLYSASVEQTGQGIPPPPYTPVADAASALPVPSSDEKTAYANDTQDMISSKVEVPSAPLSEYSH